MLKAQVQRADRISGMEISKILRLAQRARDMRAAGKAVVDLSAGQPDFDTPPHICEAAVAAMANGETRYTAIGGTPALKDAIAGKFERDNGLTFRHDQIMAGAGAKQLLFNAFMAVLNPGDEVVLPTPCWLSYFDIVRIAAGVPVGIPSTLEAGFKVSPDQLRAAISDRTRFVLLNSPSNPSGAVYDAQELGALLDVIAEHPQVWVMADDVYEPIRFAAGDFATPANVRPALRSRILTVNAVSKAYAMTGWRLGYCAGPADLIAAMSIVQSQSTSNPCSISQAAAAAALSGPQDFLQTGCETYCRRRDLMVGGVEGIEGFECRPPEGAFFLLARVAGLLGRVTPSGKTVETDSDLSEYLLEAAHVVTVPGSEFGADDHLRLSFALGDDDIVKAIAAIKAAVTTLT